MNKRGIILIATGDFIYIKMAFNLACSLRKCGGQIPIYLLSDGCDKELTDFQRFQFLKVIQLTPEQSKNPFMLKLFINEFSPFDETIYMDVDMLWMPFKTVDSLFDSLKDVDFTIANRGLYKDENDWIDTKGREGWVDCSSEFIYWKKSENNDDLFKEAQDFYLSNTDVRRTIGGFQPDEPSISFAMNQREILPHRLPYHPSYWGKHGYEPEHSIKNNYYLLSMGGNFIPSKTQRLYNALAQYYANELGAGTPYPHLNKNKIKQRSTI